MNGANPRVDQTHKTPLCKHSLVFLSDSTDPPRDTAKNDSGAAKSSSSSTIAH